MSNTKITERWVRSYPAPFWQRVTMRLRGQSHRRIVTIDPDERDVVEVSGEVLRSMLRQLGFRPEAPEP